MTPSLPPIGSFTPENRFFLAPMEAVNCASFRVLCRKRGAGLVYTDMIDADVFYEYASTSSVAAAIQKFVNPQDDEQPLAIQVGGSRIETLVYTIKAVEAHATLIDFNIGCPLSYMLGKKGGVYLSKHPDQLYKIVRELRLATTKPFTVKIRAGWDKDSINAVAIAQELEKLGVDAIALHPRTRKQQYRDKADWQLARQVKEAINIPFILSGDVTNTYLAKRAFEHVKCDYIMIARGAQRNPSIFTQLKERLGTDMAISKIVLKQVPRPNNTYDKQKELVRKDLDEFLALYRQREQQYKFSQLQDHAIWLAKECEHNKDITQEILDATNEDDLRIIFKVIEF